MLELLDALTRSGPASVFAPSTTHLLVATRVAALLLLAPLPGGAAVGFRIRAVFVCLVTLLITPTLTPKDSSTVEPTNTPTFAPIDAWNAASNAASSDVSVEASVEESAAASSETPTVETTIGNSEAVLRGVLEDARHQTPQFVRLLRELTIGLALGLVVRLVLSAVLLAGQTLAQLSGLGMAETLAGESATGLDSQASSLANLLSLISVALLVAVGGHRQIVAALLDSFQWLPPGELTLPDGFAPAVFEASAKSLEFALRIAAPAGTALVAATLVAGLLSRALPQVNAMLLSSSANLLLTLALVLVGIGGLGWLLQDQLATTLDSVRASWSAER